MTDRRPPHGSPPQLPGPASSRLDLREGVTRRDETKTPVAVALQHEMGDVPKVVAAGRGQLAEKILQIAFESGVKVRQDRDLAELLAAVPVDAPIPDGAFEAVAEILRYLYEFNRDAGGGAVR